MLMDVSVMVLIYRSTSRKSSHTWVAVNLFGSQWTLVPSAKQDKDGGTFSKPTFDVRLEPIKVSCVVCDNIYMRIPTVGLDVRTKDKETDAKQSTTGARIEELDAKWSMTGAAIKECKDNNIMGKERRNRQSDQRQRECIQTLRRRTRAEARLSIDTW